MESVQWAFRSLGSPGRGGHPYAMRAAETAFRCRETAARLFGVESPEQVVFTFNATHGLNIAIDTLVPMGGRAVISGYEHNSVLRPLLARGAEVDVAAVPLFAPEEEVVAAFAEKLRWRTDAVVVNHVSNVFGSVNPVEKLGKLCRERGVPMIIDASQSAGVLPVSLAETGAAFIAMPGHKGLYGPQGTGLLLCGHEATPLLHGGSGSDSASGAMPDFLPDRLEAGTHNMPGIAGLLAGLRFVEHTGLDTIRRHEERLTALLARELARLEGVTVYAAGEGRLQTGVLSFTLQGVPSEEAGRLLAERGVCVRAGLHCAPLAHKTAGTFPDGTVRASVSAFTGQIDAYALPRALRELTKRK